MWLWRLVAAAAVANAGHVHDRLAEYGVHHDVRVTSTPASTGSLVMSVTGEKHALVLEVSVDTSHFSDTYMEVHWSPDAGFVVKKHGPPRCHYSGIARLNAEEVAEEIGAVYVNLCDDVEAHAVMRFEKHSMELRGFDGKHVLVDSRDHVPKDPFFCSVGEHFEHDHNHTHHPHEEEHDDHGDHDHHHDEHDHHAHDDAEEHRRLLADECSLRPDKFIEVVAFNDHSRVDLHGIESVEQHTASMFALVSAMYHADDGVLGSSEEGWGLYHQQKMQCDVRVRLAGQVSFRDGNPGDITYTRSPEECRECCAGGGNCDWCSSGEVSSFCLLDSFSYYAFEYHIDELLALFGDKIDTAQLITSEDFGGSTIGLGYIGSLCTVMSVAVSMARGSSLLADAGTVAHEMGHNLGMEHDSRTGNIMSTYVTSNGDARASQWSDESRAYALNFFETNYGSFDSFPTCAETDPGEGAWVGAVCGDGVVDEGEECDAGFGFGDNACCGAWNSNDACFLINGCQCSDSQLCCEGGQFVNADVVCRSGSQCDLEERCTGESGDCPVDTFESPGTPCSEMWQNTEFEGLCYNKECVSKADDCGWDTRWPWPTQSNDDHGCNRRWCSDFPTSSFYWFADYYPHSEDGVPCLEQDSDVKGAESYQCLSADYLTDGAGGDSLPSVCVPSSQLKTYAWVCEGGSQAECLDEAGELASNRCAGTAVECSSVSRPTRDPTKRPTRQPAPRPTSKPTRTPTSRPTLKPTSTPTRSPTHAPSQTALYIFQQSLRFTGPPDYTVFKEAELANIGRSIADELNHDSVSISRVASILQHDFPAVASSISPDEDRRRLEEEAEEGVVFTYRLSLDAEDDEVSVLAKMVEFVVFPSSLNVIRNAVARETSLSSFQIVASAEAHTEISQQTAPTPSSSSSSSSNGGGGFSLPPLMTMVGAGAGLLIASLLVWWWKCRRNREKVDSRPSECFQERRSSSLLFIANHRVTSFRKKRAPQPNYRDFADVMRMSHTTRDSDTTDAFSDYCDFEPGSPPTDPRRMKITTKEEDEEGERKSLHFEGGEEDYQISSVRSDKKKKKKKKKSEFQVERMVVKTNDLKSLYFEPTSPQSGKALLSPKTPQSHRSLSPQRSSARRPASPTSAQGSTKRSTRRRSSAQEDCSLNKSPQRSTRTSPTRSPQDCSLSGSPQKGARSPQYKPHHRSLSPQKKSARSLENNAKSPTQSGRRSASPPPKKSPQDCSLARSPQTAKSPHHHRSLSPQKSSVRRALNSSSSSNNPTTASSHAPARSQAHHPCSLASPQRSGRRSTSPLVAPREALLLTAPAAPTGASIQRGGNPAQFDASIRSGNFKAADPAHLKKQPQKKSDFEVQRYAVQNLKSLKSEPSQEENARSPPRSPYRSLNTNPTSPTTPVGRSLNNPKQSPPTPVGRTGHHQPPPPPPPPSRI